jgi:hypothetical protein
MDQALNTAWFWKEESLQCHKSCCSLKRSYFNIDDEVTKVLRIPIAWKISVPVGTRRSLPSLDVAMPTAADEDNTEIRTTRRGFSRPQNLCEGQVLELVPLVGATLKTCI